MLSLLLVKIFAHVLTKHKTSRLYIKNTAILRKRKIAAKVLLFYDITKDISPYILSLFVTLSYFAFCVY